MVFDIGMPNIAVNPLDGAFEIVKHKKRQRDEINLLRFKGGARESQAKL